MEYQPASGNFGRTAGIVNGMAGAGMAGGRRSRRSRRYGAKPKSFRKRRSLRRSSSKSKKFFGW